MEDGRGKGAFGWFVVRRFRLLGCRWDGGVVWCLMGFLNERGGEETGEWNIRFE